MLKMDLGEGLDEKSHFEYLPGYNDPQTFFMMGEDVNTCMSIRARQRYGPWIDIFSCAWKQ